MRHTTSRFGLAWVHVLVLLAMAVLAVLAVLGGAPRQALAGHDPDAAGQDAGGRVLALPDLLGSDAPVSQAGDVPTLAQRLALAADAERVSVETEQELVAAAKSVGQKATIVLSADIVLGSGPLEVTDGREFTLDLNGHGLSRNLQAADSDGHVIYIEPHCKLSIVDHGPNRQGTISGGWVSGYGGGILNDGTLDMVNGTIRDNKATIAGAGIANRGDATLTSTTIENNSCRNEGGGVHCERDATIALSGCYIEDNEADSGGGIYLNRLASAVKIMGCHIVGNRARVGGGLYDFVWPDNDQAILAVVSTTMSQNVATEDGGAIYGTAAFGHDTGPATPPITLDSNSKILNNKAGGRGGGIFLEKRYVAKARDVKVSGNECATSGGGIFVDGEEAEAGTLQMEGYVKVEENVRVTAVEESGRTSEGDNVRFAGPFERGTHVQVGFDASLSRRMVTTGYERHCAKEDEGGDVATPDPGQFFEGDGDRAAVLRDGEVMVVTRVHYMDERGQEQVIVDYEDVTDAFEGTKGKDGWFVAAHDVELDARPTIDAKASLVVCDGATLTCKQGIEVPKAGSLAVYGQVRQTGTIVAENLAMTLNPPNTRKAAMAMKTGPPTT